MPLSCRTCGPSASATVNRCPASAVRPANGRSRSSALQYGPSNVATRQSSVAGMAASAARRSAAFVSPAPETPVIVATPASDTSLLTRLHPSLGSAASSAARIVAGLRPVVAGWTCEAGGSRSGLVVASVTPEDVPIGTVGVALGFGGRVVVAVSGVGVVVGEKGGNLGPCVAGVPVVGVPVAGVPVVGLPVVGLPVRRGASRRGASRRGASRARCWASRWASRGPRRGPRRGARRGPRRGASRGAGACVGRPRLAGCGVGQGDRPGKTRAAGPCPAAASRHRAARCRAGCPGP